MRLIWMLQDAVRVSFQMILSHKLRSLLSILGIVFGILTLIVTLAIGEGTRQKIMRTIESMGANLVHISIKPQMQEGQNISYRPLNENEIFRLNQLKGVDALSSVLSSAVLMRLNEREEVITVEGVEPGYGKVRELILKRGRFISDEDIARKTRVAILGADLAQKLKLGPNPLGQTIHVLDTSFQVIGLLDRKGRTIGADLDKQIIIPISSLQEIQGRPGEVQSVWIRALRSELTRTIIGQAEMLLARKDLEIWDQEALLLKKDRITRAFKWALGAIALVSLLIGGIGVMNVLLVSVSERIKEIGIRKAVGANFYDILLQFLFESVFLTLIGAVLGIALGVMTGDYAAWMLNLFIPSTEGWQADYSWEAIAVAIHFTFWVGLIFGVYPAWKAASLDPCEALTYY